MSVKKKATEYITPTQFLYKRGWIQNSLLISAMTCLVTSLILMTLFFATIQRRINPVTQKPYISQVNKNYLIASMVFAIFSFGLFSYITFTYYQIFIGIANTSPAILGILSSLLLSAVIFGVDLFFYFKTYIPLCPLGTTLNAEGVCVTGCNFAQDCPPHSACLGGQCCDLTVNQQCGSLCCPQSDGCYNNEFCCEQPLCGNQCCSAGTTCSPSTNQCVSVCGPITCSDPSQYCAVIPISLDSSGNPLQQFNLTPTSQALENGNVYACLTPNPACSPLDQSIAYPYAIHNFYSCYDTTNLTQDQVNTLMAANWSDPTSFQNDIVGTIGNLPQNQNHAGFFCGGDNSMQRLYNTGYTGPKCSAIQCLNDVPQNAVNMQIVTDSSQHQFCNMLINCIPPETTSSATDNVPLLTYYTLSNVEKNSTTGKYQSSIPTSYNFLPVNTISSPSTSSTSSASQSLPMVYTNDCNAFSSVITSQDAQQVCWFDPTDTYTCVIENNSGFINEWTVAQNRKWVIRFGLYSPTSSSGTVNIMTDTSAGDAPDLFQSNAQTWYPFVTPIIPSDSSSCNISINITNKTANTFNFHIVSAQLVQNTCGYYTYCSYNISTNIPFDFYWVAVGICSSPLVNPSEYSYSIVNQLPTLSGQTFAAIPSLSSYDSSSNPLVTACFNGTSPSVISTGSSTAYANQELACQDNIPCQSQYTLTSLNSPNCLFLQNVPPPSLNPVYQFNVIQSGSTSSLYSSSTNVPIYSTIYDPNDSGKVYSCVYSITGSSIGLTILTTDDSSGYAVVTDPSIVAYNLIIT